MKKLKLKFSDIIPLNLEYALIHKYGFTYYARKKHGWVIYERLPVDEQKIDFSDLSEEMVNQLNKRCNTIAGCFQNPSEHKDIIRTRITNMSDTLEPKARAWVLDWIKRVIDEEPDDDYDEFDPPFEVDCDPTQGSLL